MKFGHHRTGALLMKAQAFGWSESALARFGVVAIHLTEHLQHVAAFRGKVGGHFHDLPSAMRQAVGQQNFHARGHVAGQCIAHQNRSGKFGRAALEDSGSARRIWRRLLRVVPRSPMNTGVIVADGVWLPKRAATRIISRSTNRTHLIKRRLDFEPKALPTEVAEGDPSAVRP